MVAAVALRVHGGLSWFNQTCLQHKKGACTLYWREPSQKVLVKSDVIFAVAIMLCLKMYVHLLLAL